MMEYVFADDTEGHQLTERICSGIDERVSARIGERISPELVNGYRPEYAILLNNLRFFFYIWIFFCTFAL